ncbi:sialidase family protein [Planctomicrobium sp. SH527]|uniref:sialidase family protein n=1 Tax=Planctomicrobium sp. SH527 TaxID=3448123 RepID=UPI003F5BE917
MHQILGLGAFLGMVLLAGVVAQADSTVVRSEDLYETAPFPSVHASTIEQSEDGNLIAAFFGGQDEGKNDVGIWVTRQLEGKWSPPVEVANGVQANGTRHPCWNPVLFQPSSGPLLLFYKVGPRPSTWWGMLKSSTDNGATWSEATRLPDGILGPVKNKPVELSDGVLLSGSSSEHDGWRVHFERSTDLGKTWKLIGPVNDGVEFSAIQPSILKMGGDKLLAIGRTKQKSVFQIASEDAGKTWGKMTASSLPNPNSGTDAITLSNGKHLIVYNHTIKGRSPLNVAISDDGVNWRVILVLENDPGEYSYPAVIQTKDGHVHITYTWNRKKVRHLDITSPIFTAKSP